MNFQINHIFFYRIYPQIDLELWPQKLYPLVICYMAIEKAEIVSFPIQHGGSFQFVFCERLHKMALEIKKIPMINPI